MEENQDKTQPEKGVRTGTKIGISLVVGGLASAFAWFLASISDPSLYKEPKLNLDEGDTEYSTPEFLCVPSHLTKKVREEGSVLLHWVDEFDRAHFKTARKYEAQEILVDEEEEA